VTDGEASFLVGPSLPVAETVQKFYTGLLGKHQLGLLPFGSPESRRDPLLPRADTRIYFGPGSIRPVIWKPTGPRRRNSNPLFSPCRVFPTSRVVTAPPHLFLASRDSLAVSASASTHGSSPSTPPPASSCFTTPPPRCFTTAPPPRLDSSATETRGSEVAARLGSRERGPWRLRTASSGRSKGRYNARCLCHPTPRSWQDCSLMSNFGLAEFEFSLSDLIVESVLQ
jgi:hypothetical protein